MSTGSTTRQAQPLAASRNDDNGMERRYVACK